MGHRSALISNKTALVQVDQAVFTSIRSPMGEGYRIIAASAGITTDEKREIIKCSPSHGSLCADGEDASALSFYTLRSGRQCVALSRHAGMEHTGRGGLRVHTHIVVLEAEQFDAFQSNALHVSAAMRHAIGDEPTLKPPSRFEPLDLDPTIKHRCLTATRTAKKPEADQVRRAADLLDLVIAERRFAVINDARSEQTCAYLMSGLPESRRAACSFSYGLKFTNSRQFSVVFAGSDRHEIERIIQGHSLELVDAQDVQKRNPSAWEAWLQFVQRCWIARRADHVDRLSARLGSDVTPAALEQIAIASDDRDSVAQADRFALVQLQRRYSVSGSSGDLHAQIASLICQAAEKRICALDEEERRKAQEAAAAEAERIAAIEAASDDASAAPETPPAPCQKASLCPEPDSPPEVL